MRKPAPRRLCRRRSSSPQANAICKQGGDEIDEAATEAFGKSRPSPEEIEQFTTETLVPNVQQQIDDLSALGAPEGDEAQVQEILDSAQSALEEVEADPTGVTEQPNGDDPFAETNRLATAYGLDECAG